MTNVLLRDYAEFDAEDMTHDESEETTLGEISDDYFFAADRMHDCCPVSNGMREKEVLEYRNR
jgi:hypothetical protein